MRKSNLNPIFLKFTGIIKGVPKYWAQNSHLIYAISLVLFYHSWFYQYFYFYLV